MSILTPNFEYISVIQECPVTLQSFKIPQDHGMLDIKRLYDESDLSNYY